MIKSITSVKVTNRRVILRAGFDVPLKDKHGTWRVADDTRIVNALPTLEYLIKQNAKIVIMAHLGRPKGWQMEKSLWPAAEKLGELLKYKVVKVSNKLPDYHIPHIYFLTENIEDKDHSALTEKMRPGDILFLENLRFYAGEQDRDEKFVDTLAQFGDVYVNDAFSNAHRKDSSMVGLAEKLPSYAGISLAKEIQSLQRILTNPTQPLIVLIGGAKIDDKVSTIHNLAKHASHILVGGAIGNSFLAARGYDMGKSRVSDVNVAKELLRDYKDKIVLPVDLVVAADFESHPRLVTIEKVKKSEMALDIGPVTIRKYSALIKTAKTLVWNGPFGFIENTRYAYGSRAMAHVFSRKSKGPAYGIVGGGETIEAINQAGVSEFIDHISMGGGAMLEFLSGKKLPAIKALEKK